MFSKTYQQPHQIELLYLSRALGYMRIQDTLYVFLNPKTEPHYVAQANLELTIVLPQPSKCWDYMCVLPYLNN